MRACPAAEAPALTQLSALVLEDEWPARNLLVELLRGTGEFGNLAAVATVQEAKQVLECGELGIQVVFADIRLTGRPDDVSGLQWVRSLQALPQPPMVVLATAVAHHAVEGFELGAVDYLLKPYAEQRVQRCVERLLSRHRSATEPSSPLRLVARDQNALVFLEVEGMLAFEAADRLTYVHHDKGKYCIDLSLQAIDALLESQSLRVHRNWLVAPHQVRSLARDSGELVLRVGETLVVPVSRDRARAVREQLLKGAIGIRTRH